MIVPYEIYYVTDVLPAAHNWTSPKTKFIICFVIKRRSSKWCCSLSQSPILIQTPVAAFPGEMCSVGSAVIFPGEFRGRTDEKGDEKGGCRWTSDERMLEKHGERRRECWRKQPAQDEERPLGLPENSEEHPSFDDYGSCLLLTVSPKAICQEKA